MLAADQGMGEVGFWDSGHWRTGLPPSRARPADSRPGKPQQQGSTSAHMGMAAPLPYLCSFLRNFLLQAPSQALEPQPSPDLLPAP